MCGYNTQGGAILTKIPGIKSVEHEVVTKHITEEPTRTATDKIKLDAMRAFLRIVPKEEIDALFLLFMHFMVDNQYELRDTPEELLQRINRTPPI
jgi:hypothetical protein